MATIHPPLTRPAPLMQRWAGSLSGIAEGRLRAAAALTVLCSQILGAIGLAWDIQWHISVGRDTFLTPPHILLYTAVALTGLVSLQVVLVDTLRSRRGQDVREDNSLTVFGVFRAPLGFVVAGFGALVTATAAPLDNYWHELYGVDVALWAPFHTMGSLGGFIGLLGMLYAWGSLLVQARGEHAAPTAARSLPAWGLLATLMLLVGTASVQARPALIMTPLLHLGPLSVALYPVLLGLFVPWLLVLARVALGRQTGPLQLVALWSAFTTGLLLLVPWLVRVGAAAEGLPLRGRDAGLGLTLVSALLMLGLFVVAGISTYLLRRWPLDELPERRTLVLVGGLVGLGLWLAGGGIVLFTSTQVAQAAAAGLPVTRTAVGPWALALALPMTAAAGVLSTAVGAGLAQVLRRSPR